MSDNQNLEQVLEGPGTVVDKPEDWFPEAKSDPAEALDSEQSHASLAEDSNGHAAEPEVPLERGDSDDVVEPANQASLSSPIDRVGSDIGDAGKEDMFVDCPDELATANADNKIAVVTTGIEESSEEKNGADENGGLEMKNGTRVSYVVDDELDHLRAKLEKTLSEKEGIAREYQEERQAIAKEVAELHHHLKALANKQPMLVLEKDNLVGDTPLLEMVKDCSQFLKTASEERLDTETAVRELHALLYAKEKEIEDLNARVSEISVSNDVVGSYWSSFQNEKDRQVEDVANRMLTSLALVGYKEEPLDDSGLGKIIQLEKGTSLLIEKFNHVLSEIDQLGQCLSGAGADLRLQEEYGNICVAARDQLLELKSKEVNLVEKVRHLEDENRKFMVQLEKDKEMAEMVNAELAKTKMELEQEKVRCANTKEKLTMAVTKGKALVQQRDSLKQSLAEKTSELEKCVLELEEKSSALEAAELSKEELVRSDNLVASLQETLLQRNAILEKVEEILSENAVPQEIDLMDIIERFRWLVDDRNLLKDVSMEFQNLKDAFFSIDLPETVSSSNLEARFSYLRESFYQAKNEKNTLQHEIAITREAARNEIDRLSASLSTALQEKDYLQTELADLMCKWEETVERERLVSLENERLSASLLAELQEKDDIRIELADLMSKYEEIVEKEQRVSLDRDQTIKILLEISGTEMENEEAVYQSSENSVLIHRCFEKIKEQSSASSDSYHVNAKVFETIQCLLYVRDQELMLFEKLLEEEMMVRLKVDKLSCELKSISEELVALKEEKGSLLKDLERSEEKSALLRERLSMAVKKGKGLVQDRENLKNLLDEKNSEIEKLKLKLQQQESAVADCRDQIKTLSIDVECIPKLEADLVAMKDQRDQLEQFLAERNKLLQRLVESIDGIVLPVESVFEDPIGKVNLLAGYVNECLDARTHAEQELRKVEEDASTLASKLEEAKGNVKSLEDALAVLENNVSQLAEEKREIEVGKTNVEQELQKAIEEACSHTTKFVEACATRKSLEEALSQAENKISVFLKEKEDARVSRDAVEMELDKVKGEVAIQTSKLTEAYKTIKSLEDSLSQVETNVTLLTERNNYAQVDRTNLENEVKKLQEEAGSQANKLADACATIKSMEDALLKAENDISVLVSEKKNAEEKVLLLNSKLDAALEELDGTSGSLKSRSVELTTHFNDLQGILNVAICHSDSPKGTAEISSANYPARDYGIRAGMFVRDAKALCPRLVIFPYNFEAYEEVADQFYNILHKHCNKVQAVSCDEAFLDVTDSEEDPQLLALTIRKEIIETTGCTASAGIAGNMLMARLATRTAKPDGQCFIPPEKVDDYLSQLTIKALPGIGRILEEKLKKQNVLTCGQLRMISKDSLQKDFGMKTGEMLWNYSRGIDNRLVGVIQESKSIGAEVNWGVRFKDVKDSQNFLSNLCKEVSLRLQGCGVLGHTFTLKIKKRRKDAEEPAKYMGCGDCENLSHSTTVPIATDDVEVLQRITNQLFRSFHLDVKEIRGIGLQVSRLESADNSKQGFERYSLKSWLTSASASSEEPCSSSRTAKERLNIDCRGQGSGTSGQIDTNLVGLSIEMDNSTSDGENQVSEQPPLCLLDTGVLESLPPELFSELNEVYGGKLVDLIAKRKGKSEKISSTLSISSRAQVKGATNEGQAVLSDLVLQSELSIENKAKQKVVEEVQAVLVSGAESYSVGVPASGLQKTDLMPLSLSQVDVTVLQQLPKELKADILGHLPEHRGQDLLSNALSRPSTEIPLESLGIKTTEYPCGSRDSVSENSLWAGSPPHWVLKFKISNCLILNILAEMYYVSGSGGTLSQILQRAISVPKDQLDASRVGWDEATYILCELLKQYIKLKIEFDFEEIYVCFRLLKRFAMKSELFLQVHTAVLPYLQALVGENYGGNLYMSLKD